VHETEIKFFLKTFLKRKLPINGDWLELNWKLTNHWFQFRLVRIRSKQGLIFRIGTEIRISLKNWIHNQILGFTYACGTGIKLILIHFLEPRPEVLYKSKEATNIG
jgi:hypothetical protein